MNTQEHSIQTRYVIAGHLSRDTILPYTGVPLQDVPGGSLLYTAVGASIWDEGIGLVGRAGCDYPQAWLEEFSRRRWDVRGIKILPDEIDMRYFTAYTSNTSRDHENPVTYFANAGLTFPLNLMGYKKKTLRDDLNHLEPTSPRTSDFPPDYPGATAAHLCAMDYLTQNLLQPLLREGEVSTITLRASNGYMIPEHFNKVLTLINRLTAFIASEEQIRSLFGGRASDLWEMAARLTEPGCEIVVINRGTQGLLVYHAPTRRRWFIPAYPAPINNLTGAADAFCGGFLTGYRQNYDPLEAALKGNISASLVMDGAGPFYALDGMPGLAEARLERLQSLVRVE
jgi:sugar/nucleoside kinase (ribokinase family)